MYHVFTEDEIKLWRDWIWELGEQEKKRSGAEFAALKTRLNAIDPQLAGRLSDDDLDGLLALRDRLEALNPDLVRQLPDEMLLSWQQAAADYRIALWMELRPWIAGQNVVAAGSGPQIRKTRLKVPGLGWTRDLRTGWRTV
jgi:hypothetical protein